MHVADPKYMGHISVATAINLPKSSASKLYVGCLL